MANLNRTCLACGTKYSYCGNCGDQIKLPLWKGLFDTENCKKLFATTTDYLNKEIDKEQAIKQYKECDLSYKYKLKSSIRGTIDDLLGSEKKPQKSNKKDTPKLQDADEE